MMIHFVRSWRGRGIPGKQTAALSLALVFLISACAGTEEVIEAPQPEAGTMHLTHTIIPRPSSIELSAAEVFEVTDETQIVVAPGSEEARRIGEFLASLIGNTVETTPEVIEAGSEDSGPNIRLALGGTDVGEEGYELTITTDAVSLKAAEPAGLFYGVQTIRQLLPAYVEYEAALEFPLTVPTGRIIDQPRFEWRGAMLDVARHFLAVQDVKRYIDLMALYKLNRLHIHLSDDQGWRIEIPGRPRLTSIGAASEVGGGPGGYYSTAEWAELVQYAADRFITIVPEIDMPGHTNAALTSYGELTCEGSPANPFTGIEVGFSYLCVEKEETYEFVDDVVGQIAAMTLGPYFHLGGDEVHELTCEQYAAFMERAQEIVDSHGKRIVGWDEIAEADLELLTGTIVQVWRPQNPETSAKVVDAVERGASVIISPADRIYIDMKYDSTTVLGLAWAGYNDVRNAYDWDPADYVPGLPESGILGVEAPLWAETLSRLSDVEYMAFPRLAGVAELGWSPPDRSWDEYRGRLGAHGARWTALGVNFYHAPGIPWTEIKVRPDS